MTINKSVKVFVVIVNWNRHQDTLQCLKSLEKVVKNGFSLNVVVVDNGSIKKELSYIKSFNPHSYKYYVIENQKNLGFATGNNKGINFSLKRGSDYLFLLNNDTTVDENSLVELLNASKKFKDAKIFTPKIYFSKGYEFKKNYKEKDLGRVIWSFGGSIDWNNVYATNKYVDLVDNGEFNKDFETDFATGAAMFVDSSLFEKYKGFDERYYLYLEDVDLCEKYKKDGGKIYAVSKAIVWHKVSQSSAIGSELNDYFITRNRLLFALKYSPIRSKFALLRESKRLLISGRRWQKKGVLDFYLKNYYKGSWVE